MSGLFACVGNEAMVKTYLGLYAIQHRGNDFASLAAPTDDDRIWLKQGCGRVADIFQEDELRAFPTPMAAGQVCEVVDGRPHHECLTQVIRKEWGELALIFAGGIVNAHSLRTELENQGAAFFTDPVSVPELILHLMARCRLSSLVECLAAALDRLQGGFCVMVLTQDALYVARDSRGFYPLFVSRNVVREGEVVWLVSSETCGFDLVGERRQWQQELEPGRVFSVAEHWLGPEILLAQNGTRVSCFWEWIYRQRPDSCVSDESVAVVRRGLGELLAQKAPVEADVVVPVPDSGVQVASGYSAASGIQLADLVVRNHYVRPGLVVPRESLAAHLGDRLKFSPVPGAFSGKRIILVDDSLLKGNIASWLISRMKQDGAREVHLRIGAPPIVCPCPYGVAMPRQEDLAAFGHSLEEIRERIGADSLAFLDVADVLKALPKGRQYCMACATGEFPIPLA